MKELFQSIQNKLKINVPALKYVDENWGQIDSYAPNHPVKYPLALISLDNIQWSNRGQLQQYGEGVVSITVATLKLGNTSANAPQTQKDTGYAIYELLHQIHLQLHGWKPTGAVNAMLRKSTTAISREDGMQQFRLDFAVLVNDNFVPLVVNTDNIPPILEPLP